MKNAEIPETDARDLQICESTGIRQWVLEQLRGPAKKHGIEKVILFGSRARGDYRRESDIDLAVAGGDADLVRLDGEEETDTLLQYDVVNLDHHLQPGLREKIEEEGILLYEKV